MEKPTARWDAHRCAACPIGTTTLWDHSLLMDHYANKHMDNFFLYMCPNCPRKFVHSLTASQHLQKCAPDSNMTDYTVNVRDLNKNIILELIKGVNASMRLSRDETLAGDIASLKPTGPQTTSTATQTEVLEKPAAGVQTEETLTLSATSQTEEDRMAFHMYTQTEKCKMVTCEIQTEPELLPSVPQPLVSGGQCPVEPSVPGEFVLSERALEVIKLLNSGTSAVPLPETRPHCSETHSLGSETSSESFSSKENKPVHEPKPILRSYEAPRDPRKRKGEAEEKFSSKRSAGNREPFGKSEVHQKVIRCLSPQSHSPSYSMPPMPPGADYKPFNLDNVDMDMSSDTEMGDSPVPVLPRTQKPSVIYRLIPMERSVAVGRKHHLAYHLDRNNRKKAEERKQLLESSDRFRKPSSEEQKETKTPSRSHLHEENPSPPSEIPPPPKEKPQESNHTEKEKNRGKKAYRSRSPRTPHRESSPISAVFSVPPPLKRDAFMMGPVKHPLETPRASGIISQLEPSPPPSPANSPGPQASPRPPRPPEYPPLNAPYSSAPLLNSNNVRFQQVPLSNLPPLHPSLPKQQEPPFGQDRHNSDVDCSQTRKHQRVLFLPLKISDGFDGIH